MGRQVWRMRYGFNWPLKKGWGGYLLQPIPCLHCQSGCSTTEQCPCCEGEGQKYPRIEPPGYEVEEFPDWENDRNYGWQMWENTSEGSPISPVCKSREELAHWLADNKASAFGHSTATYGQWLAMIKQGSAVSMVVTEGGHLLSGVEFASTIQEEQMEQIERDVPPTKEQS